MGKQTKSKRLTRPQFLLAVLIAVSRVLCGVHYISDVLAGLAFGTIFALLGNELFVLFVSMLGFYPVMLL